MRMSILYCKQVAICIKSLLSNRLKCEFFLIKSKYKRIVSLSTGSNNWVSFNKILEVFKPTTTFLIFLARWTISCIDSVLVAKSILFITEYSIKLLHFEKKGEVTLIENIKIFLSKKKK